MNVVRKREDSYHDIETVFYPINITDALEIITNKNNDNEFRVTGLPVGNIENNLCTKAYRLLKKNHPELPFIKMHLHKSIPVGGGLGGGSADAAFTLKLLAQKFLPDISFTELNNYALQLGSDCAYFLTNMPCFATSRGENLVPVNVDLSSYKIMLINPGIHIDTGWAYNNIQPAVPEKSIKEIILQPVETWKKNLFNDFEIPVLEKYPEIKQIKDSLYSSGAIYTSLTGSGSSVYGIFYTNAVLPTKLYDNYFCRIIN